MQELLSHAVLKAIADADPSDAPIPKFKIEYPPELALGDYSTNAALILAKQSQKEVSEVATKIASNLRQNKRMMKAVEKIDVMDNGFINFWVKRDMLISTLKQIYIDKERYGRSDWGKGKKVVVEYSSPNIAKPFTIGHLRSTIIGDAVANLLEATGWQVYRDNHLGDWGTQFGKQIYAIKTWGDEQKIESSPEPVKELVALYVKFHEEAEKDKNLEEEARKWFKKLEEGDREAKRLWEKCIEWSFKEFDRIYSRLGVKFTENNGRGYGESFFEDKMRPVIEELENKGLLKVGEEGAKLVFFPGDKYPPLMILKKDGATLYATRDLATDHFRLENYGADVVIINEVGQEQSLYFQQLYELEKMLGWVKDGQRVHIRHGHFRFAEGKMSTRKGNVIWLEEVLNEATKQAQTFGSKDTKLSEVVGIGALKWNELKRGSLADIVFDWKEILNMEGNSGPYLQYTYARTQSVLQKAAVGESRVQNKNAGTNYPEEDMILRILPRFHEVILMSAKSYSPSTLASYLYQLAQGYNSFYNKHKIVGGENEEFRLELTRSVGIILSNGLSILGITAPSKM